ncbi:MAG: hypothetical protein AMJ66_01905 [Betaproteobacteria bacterium SG8_40]|jgi:hypothetical protein|nr:MAG: hypothetical protein AMJ66_01905 [Betaproteobacteria bacterium SG8_40]
MTRVGLLAWLLATVTLIAGCAAPRVESYRDEQPVLDLREYFNGDIEAQGMFQDRSGEVIKRFNVAIKGSWSGDVGTLEEDFVYSDGTTQRRVWTITRIDEHNYIGTAGDVVGEARGEAFGNALRWRYVLALEVDGKTWHMDFDDWMFLVDDKVMLNRSEMRKFGFRVGEVTLSFRKKD